jgi:hypothetical protein
MTRRGHIRFLKRRPVMQLRTRAIIAGVLLCIFFSFHTGFSAEYFVTNTLDAGTGSLREAINLANSNPGPDLIGFNITQDDPNFDADRGVWTIQPISRIPVVTDSGLVINGVTQRDFIGEDTNPAGPEIELDGSLLTSGNGLHIRATTRVQVLHVTINRFPHMGIYLSGADYCVIAGCYLGVNYNGMQAAGNQFGIFADDTSSHNSIVPFEMIPNIVSGNPWGGIKLQFGCTENVISGNYIGVNRTATDTLGNGLIGGYAGIEIDDGSTHNEVVDNLICGNADGIGLWDAWDNFFTNNHIGTDRNWTLNLGNVHSGISIRAIDDSTRLNHIVDNDIGYNYKFGIFLEGPLVLHNSFKMNRISGNYEGGILLASQSNEGITAPVLAVGTANTINGTAIPLSEVELFTDAGNQGRIFLGEVMSDASGAFVFSLSGLSLLDSVTATVTDSKGNTSMFSTPYAVSTSVKSRSFLPGDFELQKNSPNPFNPETTIRFRVHRPGSAQLVIYDLKGHRIQTLIDGVLSGGEHQIRWKPEKLESGIYIGCLQMHDSCRNIRLVYLK